MRFDMLKDKNFGLLMFGKVISLIGSEMLTIALSLYVLQTTKSTTAFASVLAITIIPKLILGPMCGVIVDWVDRKRLMVYLDFVSGVINFIFVIVFSIKGRLSMPDIYVLVVSLSLISTIFQPTIGTIIPTIVKKEMLLEANSLNTLVLNIGKTIAPALGGMLFGFYGMYLVLLINGISFILSAISEMFIKVPKNKSIGKKMSIKAFGTDFKEGLVFIKNNKLIFNIILLGLVINCMGDPVFSIIVPYISKEVIYISDSQFGFLESAFVGSMIISPLICGFIKEKVKLEKLIVIDIVIVAIGIGVMAIIPADFFLNLFDKNIVPYISLITILCIIGIITAAANIVLNTLFQKEIPIEMLGRVGTTMTTISMGGIPLGQMVVGFLIGKIDLSLIIFIVAVVLLLTILKCKKALYNYSENRNVEATI